MLFAVQHKRSLKQKKSREEFFRDVETMATDVEESNTEDHDRPAPPKRRCKQLVKANENNWEMDKVEIQKEEVTVKSESVEYDEAERLVREKLRKWQMCQEAKGLVDNTINILWENCLMLPPSSYSVEDARFRLFRGNDMEDTAVMTAIRHHGLVQSGELISQPSAFYGDKIPGYWNDNRYLETRCSCPSNCSESINGNVPDSLRLNCTTGSEEYNEANWDKTDDSNQQEDFLERAVAEAIKKKGLIALSVDYG